MDQDKHTNFWIIISILVALKLIIHFATNTNYELHRDAFLYLAQSHHLAWGYVSIPPLTPFLARISQLFFSDSVFAVRLFPALIGAVSIILIGRIVMELGGRSWAVIIAGSTFLFSPAFLRSNTLLQPVSFNQFFWLLSSYYVLRLIKSKNPNYWFALGIIWGIAFLNKYSIAFLIVAFSIGILLTKFRKLFLTKQFLYSTGVGLLIILPNLIWQYNHDWPVISHMAELQRNQLVNVTIANFVIMQFLMNVNAIPVWLTGLLFVIVSKERAKYALFGWTFFLLMVILILLRGKAYYTLGIYPVFFAFGGYAIEKFTKEKLKYIPYVVAGFLVLSVIPILPFSLPVLKPDKMVAYGKAMMPYGGENLLRWEDGRIYPLPQDYADMIGWKELADLAIGAYTDLPDSLKSQSGIFAENYGEAGSILYHSRGLNIPETVSFSDNFLLWAPDSLPGLKAMIYVNDDTSEISRFSEDVTLYGRLTTPYAREKGIPVFVCKNPRNGFLDFYKLKVRELKSHYLRK